MELGYKKVTFQVKHGEGDKFWESELFSVDAVPNLPAVGDQILMDMAPKHVEAYAEKHGFKRTNRFQVDQVIHNFMCTGAPNLKPGLVTWVYVTFIK